MVPRNLLTHQSLPDQGAAAKPTAAGEFMASSVDTPARAATARPQTTTTTAGGGEQQQMKKSGSGAAVGAAQGCAEEPRLVYAGVE